MLLECCTCKETFFVNGNSTKDKKLLKDHSHTKGKNLFNILSVHVAKK